MMYRTGGLLTAALVALLGAGCQDDDPPPGMPDPSRVLVSVDIQAEIYQMAIGEGLPIGAYATYADGHTRDVTRQSTWHSSNPEVARFLPERVGYLESVSIGQTVITVAFETATSDESVAGVFPYEPLEVLIGTDLEPDDPPHMLRGTSTPLTANLYYYHGETEDVTDEAVWSVGDARSGVIVDGVLTALRTGPLVVRAAAGGTRGELTIQVDCPYPAGEQGLAPGLVAPRLNWRSVNDGSFDPAAFAIEDLDCGHDYEDDAALVVVLGDEGCDACDRYMRQVMLPIAPALDAAGAALLYVHARGGGGGPADWVAAGRYLHRFGWFDALPMLGVGDGEVRRGRDEMPGWFEMNVGLGRLPRVWVVRSRDMRVIADQGPGLDLLPLPDIVADVEADWSDPPPYRPPFVAACEAADEEPSEPNDTAAEATPLAPGVHPGGLCTDPAIDVYAIDLPGRWRLAVDFDGAVGDIDLALWDAAADAPLTDPDGRPLGSFGIGDREIVVHEGPAHVQIRGYANASGRYTLTLEAL